MKKLLIALLILALIVSGFALYAYTKIMSANVPENLENNTLLVPTGANFQDVLDSLHENGQLIDTSSFRKVSELMHYTDGKIKPGRYKIIPSTSNRLLKAQLRIGDQEAVNLVLTHGWLLEDVAAKAAQFIEADSTDIIHLLNDQDYIQSLGYSSETLMSLFIPNTYQFYWNTSAKDFIERMIKEHKNFWNSDRLAKANKLEMRPDEVYTLASIVEREISKDAEKKRVAGLYLNRIKVGMKLDADPTAKFATKDFGATRILYKHIRFESPYNTYLHKGLPPGPISMASIKSIDAVLDSEDHDYYYMCVDTEKLGYHVFAESIEAHNRNARKYHRWLDKYEKKNKTN